MLPDSVIKTTKKVVDVTAILTKGTAELLSNMELQHKNQFEILFTPFAWSLNATVAFQVIKDNAIAKLYVQTVEATFLSIAYERADNKQYVKDVEYPESIRMTFIEDEFGSVRRWANSLMESVAIVDDNGMFIFQDNQNDSKRNAILIPLMKSGLPSGAWVQFKGLKYMSMETVSFDQASPENMLIDITFACDNCWWKTPF